MNKRSMIQKLCIIGMMTMLLLTACQKEVSLDVQKLADRLNTEIAYEDTLAQASDAMAQMLYGYDQEDVQKAAVYISAGATTEEVAVFQCVDAQAANRVNDSAKQRIENQKESVKTYKPEELQRLEEAQLQTKGCYVVLSISSTPETARQIIQEALDQ